jgi:uncharacterized protein (TIGR02594 family)
MNLATKKSLLAACMTGSVALAVAATTADARPRSRHVEGQPVGQTFTNDGRIIQTGAARSSPATAGTSHRAVRRASVRKAQIQAAAGGFTPVSGSFSAASLISTARSYLGTNPTGRRSLWCGAFMDLVLKKNGHAGGGNLASAYAKYGTRVSGPQIGAIAVMYRKGGGHVGVVSGVDSNGNPIIISGNHNRTVAEAVYPRSRIFAYVIPN